MGTTTTFSNKIFTLTQKVINHPFFWLLLIVLVAYWPMTLQLKTAPYDMTNCWIPWRFYISDVIQNGEFPWWNPYQQMGYPIHSDLQGPTWHIESLLASMIGHQGAQSIQYTLLGYIYLGGIGFYRLASLFTSNRLILFFAACTYICSGFFTSHIMHMFVLISAAFIPFVIYYCIRLFQTKELIYVGWASIFIFLNLTGGNHSLFIITLYLILPVTLYYAIWNWKKGKDEFLRFIKNGIFLLLTSIILGSVIFGTFIQIAPYLGRFSNGLDYKMASLYPFPPAATLSWLNPAATINEKVWLGTDDSMGNGYFGILFLLFFLVYIFKRKKSTLSLILLFFSLFMLVASFGDHTIIYRWLYEYAPLIGKFRFPSYFSYFFMVSAILLGVIGLDGYWKSAEKVGWKGFLILILLIAGVAITFLIGMINLPEVTIFDAEKSMFFKLRNSDLYQNFFFYGLLQLPLMGAIFYSLWKKKIKMLAVLVVVDCLFAVQPNLFYIGVGETSPTLIDASLEEYNIDRLPPLNPVKENVFYNRPVPGLWQNINNLHKVVGFDGFNSNYFANLMNLIGRRYHYTERILTNPYVYLSDNILAESDYVSDTADRIIQSTVLLNDADYKEIKQFDITKHKGDTIRPVVFGPNEFIFHTDTKNGGLLNLLQSEYPGWEVYIDGVRSKYYIVNTMLMGVVLPKGKHEVRFSYNNVVIKVLGIISYAGFAIVLFLLSRYYVRKNKKNYSYVLFCWGVPVIIIISYLLR